MNEPKILLSARRSARNLGSNKRVPVQTIKVSSPKLLDSIKAEPATSIPLKAEIDDKQQYINPENIIKALDNGHALVMVINLSKWQQKYLLAEINTKTKNFFLFQLKRTRVKGFCVECIKKSGNPSYKKTMTKIITYCPQCPVKYFCC